MQVKELPTNNLFILLLRASSEGPSFATEEFMDKLVLGVATLALSAGAASAQAVYPGYGYAPYGYGYAATAPLYDYAGPADVAPAPHGYGPLVYAAPVYAPTPAYPAPPAAPGYYAARSVVVSQPLYDYAPGYWGR